MLLVASRRPMSTPEPPAHALMRGESLPAHHANRPANTPHAVTTSPPFQNDEGGRGAEEVAVACPVPPRRRYSTWGARRRTCSLRIRREAAEARSAKRLFAHSPVQNGRSHRNRRHQVTLRQPHHLLREVIPCPPPRITARASKTKTRRERKPAERFIVLFAHLTSVCFSVFVS